MQLSIALPTSGPWATPANIREVATSADRAGFRGVWTFQRVLYPTGTDMPAVYRSVVDPLIALGYAAAVTSRVRLGTAVVNAPFYAPAVLAKQAAALDVLSEGRLDLGLGLGWSEEEFAAAGVDMAARGRRLDEYLDCLGALLSPQPAAFEGDFYRVPESQVLPAPVQQPLPILLGGSSVAAYRRAGRRAAGWISASRATLDDIALARRVQAEAAEQAGRPAPRCIVRGVVQLRDEPGGRPLSGTLAQIEDGVAAYEHAGVDELFFDLNFDSAQISAPDADPEAAMDKARALLDHFTR